MTFFSKFFLIKNIKILLEKITFYDFKGLILKIQAILNRFGQKKLVLLAKFPEKFKLKKKKSLAKSVVDFPASKNL